MPATRILYDKSAAVAEIADSFRGSSAALLTEYRGLSVSEIAELRRSLGSGTQYAVVKNTLTKIAASQAGVDGIDDLLSGPTAIAFVDGDPVEAAKGLRDFARAHPMLVIKGGVLDGRPLSATEIARLADLESREVLLAKMAGAMTASLSQAVGLFSAPLSQVARLAAALQELKPAEPEAAPAADSAAGAESTDNTAGAESTDDTAGVEAVDSTADAEAADSAVGAASTDPAPEN